MGPPVGAEPLERWFHDEQVRLRLGRRMGRFPLITVTLALALVTLHLITGLDDNSEGRGLLGILFGARSTPVLVAWGARVHGLVVEGQIWRLLTAVFLHIGPIHLLVNVAGILGGGRIGETLFGPQRLLLIFLLSGLAGSGTAHLLGGETGVGASGAVMGVLAAIAVFTRRHRHHMPVSWTKTIVRGLMPWVLLVLLSGLWIPDTDLVGQLGGVLAGALLAFILGTPVIPGLEGTDRSRGAVLFGVAALVGCTLSGMVLGRYPG